MEGKGMSARKKAATGVIYRAFPRRNARFLFALQGGQTGGGDSWFRVLHSARGSKPAA
jgi:hypothetical protein